MTKTALKLPNVKYRPSPCNLQSCFVKKVNTDIVKIQLDKNQNTKVLTAYSCFNSLKTIINYYILHLACIQLCVFSIIYIYLCLCKKNVKLDIYVWENTNTDRAY